MVNWPASAALGVGIGNLAAWTAALTHGPEPGFKAKFVSIGQGFATATGNMQAGGAPMGIGRGLLITGTTLAVAFAGMTVAVFWREWSKFVVRASATVSIPGTNFQITAWEPLLVGDCVRTTTLTFDNGVRPHKADFDAMEHCNNTSNVGVYVDADGNAVALGYFEAKRLNASDGTLTDLHWRPNAANYEYNVALCEPKGLVPARLVANACYIGSFNFDGAAEDRIGEQWDSARWHFRPAAERPEFMDDVGG
jgi:hypothetical protein